MCVCMRIVDRSVEIVVGFVKLERCVNGCVYIERVYIE